MNEKYKSVSDMLRSLGDNDTATWIETSQPEKEPLLECIHGLAKRLDAVIDYATGHSDLSTVTSEYDDGWVGACIEVLKRAKGEHDDGSRG